MDNQQSQPALIQGGVWRFFEDTLAKWHWKVEFADGRYYNSKSFETRADAVQDAIKRGYGSAVFPEYFQAQREKNTPPKEE